jgi:hypothetical protein
MLHEEVATHISSFAAAKVPREEVVATDYMANLEAVLKVLHLQKTQQHDTRNTVWLHRGLRALQRLQRQL